MEEGQAKWKKVIVVCCVKLSIKITKGSGHPKQNTVGEIIQKELVNFKTNKTCKILNENQKFVKKGWAMVKKHCLASTSS